MPTKFWTTIFYCLLSQTIELNCSGQGAVKPTACLMSDRASGTSGTCMNIFKCEYAMGNLKAGSPPIPCTIEDGSSKTHGVCCPAEPRISEQKCEEYKQILRQPIPTKLKSKWNYKPFQNESSRDLICPTFLLTGRISGGRDAFKDEYPHQVALGYGPSLDKMMWRCGGVLISERFVLTAGHCVKSQFGSPTKVLLGDRKLSKQDDATRVILDVKETIPHPEYKPPVLYNDLALVKLSADVNLSRSILPACLPQPQDRLDHKLSVYVTGWGQLGAAESQSDVLQSVDLNKFMLKDCSGYFVNDTTLTPRLPHGLMRSQICFGDKVGIKDSCRGDSGGPAVVNKEDTCDFYLVGITSFGSNYCGYQQPGVYTNVQGYLDWLERTVWPGQIVSVKEKVNPPSTKKPDTNKLYFRTQATQKSTIAVTESPSTKSKASTKYIFLMADSPQTERSTTTGISIMTTTTQSTEPSSSSTSKATTLTTTTVPPPTHKASPSTSEATKATKAPLPMTSKTVATTPSTTLISHPVSTHVPTTIQATTPSFLSKLTSPLWQEIITTSKLTGSENVKDLLSLVNGL